MLSQQPNELCHTNCMLSWGYLWGAAFRQSLVLHATYCLHKCILEGPPPPFGWLCTLNKECNSSRTSVEDICMLASRLGPCIFIRCYMLDADIGLNNLWMTVWVSVSQLCLSLSFLQWRLYQDLNSDFLFLGSTCSSTDRWNVPFNFAKLLLSEQLVQPCLLEWDTAPSWTFPK